MQDSTVSSSDTLTAQTDENKSDNIEKINTGNVKSEEEDTVNSWNKVVNKVDSVKTVRKM